MTEESEVQVLIVDDDPVTAHAHADYVRRVPGFAVAGVTLTAADALTRLDAAAASGSPVDIVLLDMNLTDAHGLDVAHRLRRKGHDADIIAVTAVRDLQVVRSAISSGVAQYLIKPFTFAAFREKLENQRDFRLNLTHTGTLATQHEVDNALSALRSVSQNSLPKGLLEETLAAVCDEVRGAGAALSAAEVGERLALSRVTARRYLEYLAETKQAVKQPRHGTPGRPTYEYRWV
ncbi:response regulator [Microbacterium protaetiae]|uniref:Transcriptional regulatory protein n=1 Tax=Microbacterium protaetiae TaxID=2509458 RepID=A0A4P6ED67_9MICO|nr:response regulator [Microbacterium protaetiae]QAY58989.1 response regulator [Microbacterium protaetiae]